MVIIENKKYSSKFNKFISVLFTEYLYSDANTAFLLDSDSRDYIN